MRRSRADPRRPRVREHLHDLGELEETREPEDLGRDASLVERLLEGEEQPRCPAEHGAVRPRRSPFVQRDDPIRDPAGLADLVFDPRDVHLAGPVLLPRDEPLVGVGSLRGGELADQHVGGLQDPCAGSEVGVQGELGRRPAVGLPELVGELEQVEQRCPAPGVDVLVGIADGRHGVAVAEHGGHQARLRHVGVLVLVEQHVHEAIAVLTRDFRVPLDDVERQLDLVAEVDHVQLPFQVAEHGAGLRQLDPLPRRAVRAVRAVVLQLFEAPFVELDDLLRRAEVVGRLVVQRQDPVDDAGQALGRDHVERHAVEDAGAELDALRRRQDPLPGSTPISTPCRSSSSAAKPW